jgi:hypothetical protein
MQITAGVTNDAGSAGAQLIVLLTAVVATLQPVALFRRAAHLILIGWAALWTGDAVLAFTANPEVGGALTMSWLSTLLFATLYRAATGWWPARRSAPARQALPIHRDLADDLVLNDPVVPVVSVDPEDDAELTADRIQTSARIREIPTDQLRRLRDWANTHLPAQKSKAATLDRLEQLRQRPCSHLSHLDHVGRRARQVVDRAHAWTTRGRTRLAQFIDPRRATPTS